MKKQAQNDHSSKKTLYYIVWLAIAFIVYVQMYVAVRFQLEYGAHMIPKAVALMSPFIFVEGLMFFALRALTSKDNLRKRKVFLYLGLFFTAGSIIALFMYVGMSSV